MCEQYVGINMSFGQFQQMQMVREEYNLGLICQFRKHFQRGCGAFVVKTDQNIIDNERKGFMALYVLFYTRQA